MHIRMLGYIILLTEVSNSNGHVFRKRNWNLLDPIVIKTHTPLSQT